jgi:hypothetical protein
MKGSEREREGFLFVCKLEKGETIVLEIAFITTISNPKSS